jgi:pyruvate dehydrogenase E2 component (dihydrolipoamide acetyltransferase)
MDLPAPASGEIVELTIKVGDPIRSGDRIGLMKRRGAAPQPESKPAAGRTAVPVESGEPAGASTRDTESVIPPAEAPADAASGDIAAGISQLEKRQQARPETPALWAGRGEIYAGPAVRVLAKELGVDLGAVSGSGPKGRIVKEDVQQHVKTRLAAPAGSAGGGAIPPIPEVDFAAFGEIELQPMSGIQKATVTNMSRAWLNVPHVTQFDDADVTDLESFRAGLKPEMERRGVKLTPLPFLLKAAAIALREHPRFNSSLHADGEHVVMKKYFHVGIAVDTPRGLMVPVIRDVLDKTLWDLAAEARDLAGKARDRKLKPADMQGGCFTISSLGPIGGSGFTPIVNAPEVAILGVSRLAVKPVWTGEAFEPRKMLPLGLSYDHRQINGADAGAFMTFLCQLLGDIRRFVL